MFKDKRVSAIIPARDEERSIAKVVAGLLDLRDAKGTCIFDHVIVCDNGSTDNTANTARQAGANIVVENKPGYGAACLAALAVVPRSDIIVFIDGDYSFYAEQSLAMLDAIDAGADLVIGSRALGNIQPGALTLPQRVGNRLATLLIQLLWQTPITDLGPFRAVSANALAVIDMRDTAFGWTVEMQVKAIQCSLNVKEIPVDTRPRIGISKISGTVSGVVGAAIGIFGTIFKLWVQERRKLRLSHQKQSDL
ncbi:MAG: glycosyltransferase family 2 protein [Thiohalomonadales bacterium]